MICFYVFDGQVEKPKEEEAPPAGEGSVYVGWVWPVGRVCTKALCVFLQRPGRTLRAGE